MLAHRSVEPDAHQRKDEESERLNQQVERPAGCTLPQRRCRKHQTLEQEDQRHSQTSGDLAAEPATGRSRLGQQEREKHRNRQGCDEPIAIQESLDAGSRGLWCR